MRVRIATKSGFPTVSNLIFHGFRDTATEQSLFPRTDQHPKSVERQVLTDPRGQIRRPDTCVLVAVQNTLTTAQFTTPEVETVGCGI